MSVISSGSVLHGNKIGGCINCGGKKIEHITSCLCFYLICKACGYGDSGDTVFGVCFNWNSKNYKIYERTQRGSIIMKTDYKTPYNCKCGSGSFNSYHLGNPLGLIKVIECRFCKLEISRNKRIEAMDTCEDTVKSESQLDLMASLLIELAAVCKKQTDEIIELRNSIKRKDRLLDGYSIALRSCDEENGAHAESGDY